MRILSICVVLVLLAACEGMGPISGISNSGEHASAPDKTGMDKSKDQGKGLPGFPSNIYFGD
ncbi:MAG TPA: hypothetical protein VJ698_11580 [Noviherbaspirillum sp.]|uniref:hypothetical protein n=1 Tax=Noviherbaspirillum sp. TaxID=1926288 RepID=UPI002B47F846|nr:hypothetical protein [Noviherbaspirillum sp.]HJV86103.1 hypothetical protein [Noviherbaspirillum sp.]